MMYPEDSETHPLIAFIQDHDSAQAPESIEAQSAARLEAALLRYTVARLENIGADVIVRLHADGLSVETPGQVPRSDDTNAPAGCESFTSGAVTGLLVGAACLWDADAADDEMAAVERWIRENAASAPGRRLIVFHHRPLEPGRDCESTKRPAMAYRTMRRLLDCYRDLPVDAVLEGGSAHYAERSIESLRIISAGGPRSSPRGVLFVSSDPALVHAAATGSERAQRVAHRFVDLGRLPYTGSGLGRRRSDPTRDWDHTTPPRLSDIPVVTRSFNPRGDGTTVQARIALDDTVCLIADSQVGTRRTAEEEWYQLHSLRLVVAAINEIRPSCVFHLGDITSRSRHPDQIAAYAEAVNAIEPRIPLYHIPGNHDVHDHIVASSTRGRPTPAMWSAFHHAYGAAYYAVESEACRFLVLCSSLIYDGALIAEQQEAQRRWLESQLRSDSSKQTFILQHWPFYIGSVKESNDYLNLPLPDRRVYLDMLADAGVSAVFYGHLHREEAHEYRGVPLVCTSSCGAGPLAGDDSARGFRLLTVTESAFQHRFVELGGLPGHVGV